MSRALGAQSHNLDVTPDGVESKRTIQAEQLVAVGRGRDKAEDDPSHLQCMYPSVL